MSPTLLAECRRIAKGFGLQDPLVIGSLEDEITRSLVQTLDKRGEKVQQQLYCHAGQPDVVTPTHIYEVKGELTLQATQKGVGQLLLYGQCLPGRELVLVGWSHSGVRLRREIENLGIQMIALPDDRDKYGNISQMLSSEV